MPNHKWQALVESVLENVEPDAARRARLKARLGADSALGALYGAYRFGGDPTEIARTIRHLALKIRS